MSQEIERKFILNISHENKYLFPDRGDGWNKYHLFQFYLSFKPSEIRYRRVEKVQQYRGDSEEIRYFKTVKEGEGLSRKEEEKEVSKEEFYLAFQSGFDFFISKTRYEKDNASIDFYPDRLSVLEVEYDSEEEALADELIPFQNLIQEEVTGNKSYSNGTLAKERYSYLKNPYLLLQIHKEAEMIDINVFLTALYPQNPRERDIKPCLAISEGKNPRSLRDYSREPIFYKLKKSGGKSASIFSFYGKKQRMETGLFICFSELVANRIYLDLSKESVIYFENLIEKLQEENEERKNIIKDLSYEKDN